MCWKSNGLFTFSMVFLIIKNRVNFKNNYTYVYVMRVEGEVHEEKR